MKADVGSQDFNVLVVDDEVLYARAIARELERQGITCDIAVTAAEALERAATSTYHGIVLDHKLPDDDGIRIIPVLLARQVSASLVVMTAYEAIPNAIQAIRNGADDYLVKQTSIKPIVDAVLEMRRRYTIRLRGTGWDQHNTGGLLGTSSAIVAVREQLRRVASRRETTVLLTGETGVGKEVAARYLHAQSAPTGSPFVAVDCVALPSPLVESLLFGHEKGAFTGADRARDGAFYEAGEGTLFLDEIGEMDLSLQGKLLRVLESRRFHRVGSVREQPVRARVVAATNRDLFAMVQRSEFRLDLYQRLSVFPINIPPLRERREDILVLARHFVKFYSEKMGVHIKPLSREVEERLFSYDFPGNVRELKNMIERAIILTDSGNIELRHLPERVLRRDVAIASPTTQRTSSSRLEFVPGVDTIDGFERRLLQYALDRAKGVKTEAARLLGISRFQLLRRIKKYKME